MNDANGKNVLVFYAILFAMVGVVLGASALTLTLFAPPAQPITEPQFPEPRLQVRPDLAAERAGTQAQANVYGWVDKDKGIARIPITRAMQRMIERGLRDTAAQVQR